MGPSLRSGFRRRVSGRLTFTQVGDIQIARNYWGQSIHYQGIAPEAHFAMAFAINQTEPGSWTGRTAGDADVIVQRPGTASDFGSPRVWDAIVMSVPQKIVYSIQEGLGEDEDLAERLHGVVSLQVPVIASLKSRAFDYLQRLQMSSQLSGGTTALHEQAFDLVSDATSALLHAVRTTRKGPQLSQRRKTVLRAEEMILDDPSGKISVPELSRSLGVSERGLHYAFADIRSTSPKKWVQTLKLNEARRRLREAGPDDLMVKQVAAQAGFTHMGHFGQSYLKQFGERPIETLRSVRFMEIRSAAHSPAPTPEAASSLTASVPRTSSAS